MRMLLDLKSLKLSFSSGPLTTAPSNTFGLGSLELKYKKPPLDLTSSGFFLMDTEDGEMYVDSLILLNLSRATVPFT